VSDFNTISNVWSEFLLPKFTEECNRLLSYGAADSTRCMGLCAHCMCRSTMPIRETKTT